MSLTPPFRAGAIVALAVCMAAPLAPAAQLAGAHHAAQPRPLFDRPNWSELELPADFQGPSSVHTLGTSGAFQTPTHVYLWSAITGAWTAVPASPTAQVTQYNDYITIEDGTTLHGYSTRTGRVETLHLSGVPQVYHGSTSSCWLSIAVVGSEAWGFGAFQGIWHHTTLAGPPTSVSVAQTAGLLNDGVHIWGASAYYGDLVQSPAPPSAATTVGGEAPTAWTPTELAGFSAHTNQWSYRTATNAVLLANQRGFVFFSDGNELVAYSGITGGFTSTPVLPGYSATTGAYVGAVIQGNDVLAYSSGQNQFRTRSFASAPAVSMAAEVLAVADSAGVCAFSVATGDYSSSVPGSFSVTTNDAEVWIANGTQGHAYCAVRGTWSPAPIALGPSVQVSVLRNLVVLADAQGYQGFSGRTGDWVAQSVTTPFQYQGPSTGDMFVAFDGLQALAFDPVIVRWSSVPLSGPVQSQDIWRLTYVGFDGTRALGYGLMNNVWSTMPVRGSFVQLDANSSGGYLLTSTHLYAFCALGSLSSYSRYPEFSMLQPIGVPLHLIQVAPPGSQVVAMFAHDGGFQSTPAGTLFIDPGSVFQTTTLGSVPASGLLDVSVDLSGVPGVLGSAVHVQTLILPPNGVQRFLANSVSPVLL